MRTPPWALRVVLVLLLALAGCGGNGDAAGEDASPADTATPADTAATEAAGDAPVGPLEPSEPFGLATVTLRSPDGAETEVPVYVADDPESRQRGLMFREELPAGTGMVFAFPDESSGGFWMANTLIPLSIAFFDADGTVVAVLDMEPCTEEDLNDCPSYEPGTSYHGALEVNQGFFDEVGLVEGWTIDVPDDVSADS